VPSRAPFDMWDRDTKHGVKLYIRKVFITDDAEQLMPRYLRFIRGIIDANSLPLNVSREILQQASRSAPSNRVRLRKCWVCWKTWPRLSRKIRDVLVPIWSGYQRRPD